MNGEKSEEAKEVEVSREIVEIKTEEISVPGAQMLVPAASIEEILNEWDKYLLLTDKLLKSNDYQKIGDKRFKKKSAWRKYARAFNLTDRILKETIVRDDHGEIIRAEYIVECIAPNNRRTVGIGRMHRNERKFAHIEHDLPAIAHVRAKNRAISDMIGSGERSAEEMEDQGNNAPLSPPPQPSRQAFPRTSSGIKSTDQPAPQDEPKEQPQNNGKDVEIGKLQITKLAELSPLGRNSLIINDFCNMSGVPGGYRDLTNDQRQELLSKLSRF